MNEYAYIQGAVNAFGITQDESLLLRKLIEIYDRRLTKNFKRKQYYEDKNTASNLGIAVPRKFESLLGTKIGWAAKGVDKLAERSQFDGFLMGGDENAELDDIFDSNDIAMSYQMAVTSELIHGVGFWAVNKKEDDSIGIRFFSAEDSCAIWHYDKRRIKAGFVITDYTLWPNNKLEPCRLLVHLKDRILDIQKVDYGAEWYCTRYTHTLGRPCMVQMAYRPSQMKPFGKSRITEAAMDIVDEMQREILRTSIASELFSAPMRYIIGISDDNWEGGENEKKLSYWTNLLTMNRDEEGNVPQVGQLATSTMQPHIDVMRNLASRMAAEMDLCVNEFGIIHDQPASAEALRASMESLCVQAELLNKINGKSLIEIAKYAIAIKRNKSYDSLTEDEKRIRICWKNPFTPSIASTTDAMLKQASVSPWLKDSEVYWEMLGYNEAQRDKLFKDKERIEAEMEMKETIRQLNVSEMQNKKETEVEEENGDSDTDSSKLIQE